MYCPDIISPINHPGLFSKILFQYSFVGELIISKITLLFSTNDTMQIGIL